MHCVKEFAFCVLLGVLGYSNDAFSEIPICECTKEYVDNISIIFLDRTTTLSENSKEQFLLGVKSIVLSDKISGRLIVYDVGATDYDTKLIMNACISPYSNASSDAPGKFSVFDVAMDYVKDRVGIDLRNYNIPFLDNSSKSIDGVVLEEVLGERSDVLEKIRSYVNTDKKETKTTALMSELVRVVKELSYGKKSVKLFVYTDMEDTHLRNRLSDKKTDWDKIGQEKGEYYRGVFHLADTPGNVSVVFWGIGRNEIGKDAYLKAEQAEKLQIFWKKYLAVAFKLSSEHNTLLFRKDFPYEFF